MIFKTLEDLELGKKKVGDTFIVNGITYSVTQTTPEYMGKVIYPRESASDTEVNLKHIK